MRLADLLASGDAGAAEVAAIVALLEPAWRAGHPGAEPLLRRFDAGRALLDAAAAARASAVLAEEAAEAEAAAAAAAARREKRRAAKARSRARRADASDGRSSDADAPDAPATPPPDVAAAERATRAAAELERAAQYEAALEARRTELAAAAAAAAAASAAAAAAAASAPSSEQSEQSESDAAPASEDDAQAARSPAAPPPATASDTARCALLERALAESRDEAARLRSALCASRAEADQLRRATLGLASINRTLAAVGEGLCLTNARAEMVYVNEGFTRLFGFSKAECLGRNCAFLQGPGTCPVARHALSVAIRAGRAIRLDILNYRRDGTSFWNDLSITPVRAAGAGPDAPVQFYVGLQSDVSARYAGGRGGAATRPPLPAPAAAHEAAEAHEARRAQGTGAAAASAALLTPDAIQSLLQLDWVDDAQLFCDVHASLA